MKSGLKAGYRLKIGRSNSAGIRSSRKNSNWTLAPKLRPASRFSGTMASAATCHVSATYDSPGLAGPPVLCPKLRPIGLSNANSISGKSGLSGSPFGGPPVKRSVR
jgi:hypothetical protein